MKIIDGRPISKATQLWSVCRHIVLSMGFIDNSDVRPFQIYEDKYVKITGPIWQRYDANKNETVYEFRKFHVDIKKKSNITPLAEPSQVTIGLEPRKRGDGLKPELFNMTRVASIKLRGEEYGDFEYYRAGRWENYIIELSHDLNKLAEEYEKLNNQPIDDSDLFPDKYKLEEPKSET